MSINAIRYTFSAALFSVATIVTQAQSPSIDPTLAAQIAAIPAIDNPANPDRRQFFPLEDKLRAQYLQQANLKTLPPTLDQYLKQLVTPILEQQKSQGAIAEKFEIAYLRSFGFDDVPRPEAARIYATLLHTPHPNPAQYKRLQDFLFRYIAQECGRLNLPVHIHTISGGGGYFDIAGDNPLLLEPLFNDPRLRKTNFILLHAAWP